MYRRTRFKFLAASLSSGFLLLPSPAQTQGLTLTSPTAGAVVTGPVSFTVQSSNLQGLLAIEYLLNGRTLSTTAVAPFSESWHSGLAFDGPATVEAIARDSRGMTIARSGAVPFVVRNGDGQIKLLSPSSTQIASGIVHLSVEANRTGGVFAKPVEALIFYVDGIEVGRFHGVNQAGVDVDTRRFGNGPHEVLVTAYAFLPDAPPLAMVQAPVSFHNGRATLGVRSRFADIHVRPGQSVGLAPKLAYTDGSEGPAANATFSSNAPSVASVSSTGMVTGVAPGVAEIQTTVAALEATTRVTVSCCGGHAHFAKDGGILLQYDSARSVFVRSLFRLDQFEMTGTPGTPDQVLAAAINALSIGLYLNPGDNHPPDLAAWMNSWKPRFGLAAATAAKYDVSMVFVGDDVARTAVELDDTISNPWAPDAIRHAVESARDSHRGISIEMMDEVSALWGDRPEPTDGRWATRTPPIPDDAFRRVMSVLNTVPSRLPVTWQVAGLADRQAAWSWMGDARYSDYATIYWTYLDWRRAYPTRASFPQQKANLDRHVVGWRDALPRSQPAMLLTSVTGPYYRKRGRGGEFAPGQDELLAPGSSPQMVSAEVLYAAAMGLAGVRTYGYDGPWERERLSGAVGSEQQTGAGPFSAGSDRWQAMASAFRLIQHLEPHLLQDRMNAVDLGPWVATGASAGPSGRVLFAINFAEAPESLSVDLAPYRLGRPIERYRLSGAKLTVDVVPDQPRDTIVLAPGEAAVWLFRPRRQLSFRFFGDSTPPSVSIDSPLADSTVGGLTEVRALATDDRVVESVEFFIDGTRVGSVRRPPYTYSWNTTQASPDRWHGISVIARDRAGNRSEARSAAKVQ